MRTPDRDQLPPQERGIVLQGLAASVVWKRAVRSVRIPPDVAAVAHSEFVQCGAHESCRRLARKMLDHRL